MPMVYKVWDLNEKFTINKESLDQPHRYEKSKSAGKLNVTNKRGISEVGLNYRERHHGAQFNFTKHDAVETVISPSKRKPLAHPGIVSNPWKQSLGLNFL